MGLCCVDHDGLVGTGAVQIGDRAGLFPSVLRQVDKLNSLKEKTPFITSLGILDILFPKERTDPQTRNV